MSRASWRRPFVVAMIVLLAGFELHVAWLAIHPEVSDDYRVYYLDQTTTCLDKGTVGRYALGQTISFLPDNIPGALRIRVCGWDGPVADGTHSVGTSSMLRFAVGNPSEPLILRLQMEAITVPDGREQRVVVSGNGVALGDVTLPAGRVQAIDFTVPGAAFEAGQGALDVVLDYPDAAEMVPHDADIHFRAIRLLSVQLRRPDDPPSTGPQDDPDARRYDAAAG